LAKADNKLNQTNVDDFMESGTKIENLNKLILNTGRGKKRA